MLIALWMALGCSGDDPERDRDHDGWSIAAGDCDDRDPARHPGAVDRPDDGLDADCDGVDSGSTDLLADAIGATAGPTDQWLELGIALATGDLDDDGDAEVLVGSQHFHPEGFGMEGKALLLDGDGLSVTREWEGTGSWQVLGQAVAVAESTAGPQIALIDLQGVWVLSADAAGGHPGEVGAYRILHDPEGIPSAPMTAIDVLGEPGSEDILTACGTSEQFNVGLASVCVFEGPLTEDRSYTDPDLVVSASEALGSAITGPDLDADGRPDLVVGADDRNENQGSLFAFLGPLTPGEVDIADATATWHGEAPGDWLGERASHGDIDGDGIDELLGVAMAWPGGAVITADGERRGRVYAFDLDTPTTADAPFVLDGDPGFQHLGAALTTGDFDDDGQSDVAVGSPSLPTLDPTLPGRALVFFGPLVGHHDASEADLSYAGEAPGDAAGMGLASGDVDGDGVTDLVVSAPYNDQAAEDSGKVYLLLGPLGP